MTRKTFHDIKFLIALLRTTSHNPTACSNDLRTREFQQNTIDPELPEHTAIQNLFALHKIGNQLLFRLNLNKKYTISYFLSFNLPVKIVRPFNTYGPRQSTRAVIPSIISQYLKGNSEIRLGSLSPTRDLTFVHDTCAGFIEIYKSNELFGEIVNIGMNEEISIRALVHKISKLI